MNRFTAWGGTCVEHTMPGFDPEQRSCQLGARVLHRHQALIEARDHRHGTAALESNRLRTDLNRSNPMRGKHAQIGGWSRLGAIHAQG